MDSLLKRMLDRRFKEVSLMADHIWNQRKTLLANQRLAKIGKANDFHNDPEAVLSSKIYSRMSPDIVDKLNEILWECVDQNKQLNRSDIVNLCMVHTN